MPSLASAALLDTTPTHGSSSARRARCSLPRFASAWFSDNTDLIVGYLYYRGTKGNSPKDYAGAFDIRWANMPSTQWTVRPE